MPKYILTIELKGDDNYHCYHSLTKLWVYEKPVTVCLQNHFTKTEYRKLVPNTLFKDNISFENFVRQGFGDE